MFWIATGSSRQWQRGRKYLQVLSDGYQVARNPTRKLTFDLLRVDRLSALQVRRVKRVALAEIAGLVAFAKPADALLGGAVREGIGHDVALRAALEIIVAHHTGRAHRFVDIAGFDDVLDAIGMTRPDAGEEIRLKLEPDGELVVFRLTDAPARRLHAITDAEQILHMMSNFVRDDVGLREIAPAPKRSRSSR